MTVADIRQTILERAKALEGFPGQSFPDPSSETLERAEQIASGTVFFYGRTPVQVGLSGIDWTGGHIKHQEWPAQLLRFFHLAPLASAYLKTRDERFARAARSYIEDWIRSGPAYHAASELRPSDSTLNMAGRLGSSHFCGWAGALAAFVNSPAFDDEFLKVMADSIAGQLDFLAHHLTAWGNWRIAELDTLVFTALRLPFLRNAAEALELGIKGMRNALATQFLPDGVHIERTPSYHNWMAQVLASYYDLAKRFPEADAHVEAEALARAFDYCAQGELFPVNDSGAPHRDPGRLRQVEQRAALLRRLLPARQASDTPPRDQVFASAGHVFLRSAWEPGADYLAFDAGTWGGGHCHLSRLSFAFRSKGRELIADPGILNYEMSDPLGPYGKSTPAHSTLNINGCNQSEADARLLRMEANAATALIQAKYEGGYWEGQYGWSFSRGRGSGDWGSHERVLFWVRREYLLALDTMDADPGSSIHNCWQMGPVEAWTMEQAKLIWWSRNQDVNLLLQLLLSPEGAEMECFEGSSEPLRGWVGLHGNDAIPAPLVEFRYPGGRYGGIASAVLLAPFTGEHRPTYSLRKASHGNWGQLHQLELPLPDGATDLIAWTKGLSSAVDGGTGVMSDAPFVWLRVGAGGSPTQGFVLDGSYLEHSGRTLYQGERREARLLTF
jgi:hypothetical protein